MKGGRKGGRRKDYWVKNEMKERVGCKRGEAQNAIDDKTKKGDMKRKKNKDNED